MSAVEFLIIFILCIFQSVFGVGLLLFGTPIFLMLDYGFITTLTTILPISITISFLQIIYKKNLNKDQMMEFNLQSLPFLFIFLIFSINTNFIDMKLCISLLLIVSSLITLNENKIIQWKKYFLNYKKYFLMFIGSIHGFTNMGGGFLSILSSIIYENNKILTRSYIAYGYFIMGVIQFTTILLFGNGQIEPLNLLYPILVFYPSQKFFNKINNLSFKKKIIQIALLYGIISLVILI